MWLGHFKKFINRSGGVVELPGSLPWLVSHGVTEAKRRPAVADRAEVDVLIAPVVKGEEGGKHFNREHKETLRTKH